MNERIRSILEYMLEDAKDIIAFAQTVGTLEELRKSSLIKKGVVMSLLNIGELASKLPGEFTEEYPKIPWRSIHAPQGRRKSMWVLMMLLLRYHQYPAF